MKSYEIIMTEQKGQPPSCSRTLIDCLLQQGLAVDQILPEGRRIILGDGEGKGENIFLLHKFVFKSRLIPLLFLLAL